MQRKEDWIDRLRRAIRRANLSAQGFDPGDCTCRWTMTAEGGCWQRHHDSDPNCPEHSERPPRTAHQIVVDAAKDGRPIHGSTQIAAWHGVRHQDPRIEE